MKLEVKFSKNEDEDEVKLYEIKDDQRQKSNLISEDDESFSFDSDDDIDKSMNSEELKETKINIGCEIESQFDILSDERGNNFEHKPVLDLMMETVVNNVQPRKTITLGEAERNDLMALGDIQEETHSSESSDFFGASNPVSVCDVSSPNTK